MKKKKVGMNLVKAGFVLFTVGIFVNIVNFFSFMNDGYYYNPTGFGLCGIGFILIVVGAISTGSKTVDDTKDVKKTIKNNSDLFGDNIDNIADTLKNVFSTQQCDKKKVWKCEYCGNVNSEEDYKCTSCGAPKI